MRRFFPQLSRIAALVKYANGCSRNDVTGLIDTPYKICACYLATRCTTIDHHTIARFFKINPDFMQKELIDYAVALLMDPEADKVMNDLAELCVELELANALK